VNDQVLGFIGGSGLYEIDFVDNNKLLDIKSPWGNPSDKIIEGTINENKIFFLSRHGLGHKLSPSAINYQANIDCLKQCGVADIISLSAVGSLKKSLSPGTFVIVDQFIDRTIQRKKSFFNDGIVAHVPMAKPVSKELMDYSEVILKQLNFPYSYGGTYLAMEGPQFSTYAESNLYQQWGCDVIGMTNMPEAKLARETGVGIVCSGHEVKNVRKIIGSNLLIFTPGIRINKDNKDDQQRVCTPMESIKNGSDKIIMGRSLMKGNIEENLNQVATSIKI